MVHGEKELMRKLTQLSTAMATGILEKAVLDGAEVYEEGMRRRVPTRTGRLKKSITKETTKKSPVMVTVDVGPGKGGFYGLFLEFGTRKMAARPFMRPAFDEDKEEVVAVVSAKLKASIMAAIK